jgi:hypothetical protein
MIAKRVETSEPTLMATLSLDLFRGITDMKLVSVALARYLLMQALVPKT